MDVITTLFIPMLVICATNGEEDCVVLRHPPMRSLELCLEKINKAEESLNEVQDGSFFVTPSCIFFETVETEV